VYFQKRNILSRENLLGLKRLKRKRIAVAQGVIHNTVGPRFCDKFLEFFEPPVGFQFKIRKSAVGRAVQVAQRYARDGSLLYVQVQVRQNAAPQIIADNSSAKLRNDPDKFGVARWKYASRQKYSWRTLAVFIFFQSFRLHERFIQ
jgi:hypothetical protein